MEDDNQVTSNLSNLDQRSIKTEGIGHDEAQEGESTGVWPMNDEQHQFHQQTIATRYRVKH